MVKYLDFGMAKLSGIIKMEGDENGFFPMYR